ncbi:MAG TPA: hypothetical protein VFB21_04565 [Chthonomonadaceae bacterium]|nr:hypothetical protein [Chthonomonadaceae bacterium]
MNDQKKVTVMVIVVVLLVGLAVFMGFRSLRGNPDFSISEEYQKMDPAKRTQLEQDAERKRRSVGKPAFMHLPEDPPGFPQEPGKTMAPPPSGGGGPAYGRPPAGGGAPASGAPQ